MEEQPSKPESPAEEPEGDPAALDAEPNAGDGQVSPPEAEEGTKLGGIVPDLIRKAVVAGLGAVFTTEEGIRNVAGQLKLPKDALAYVISQADKTKSDLTRVIGDEVRRFLGSEAMRQQLLKMLTGVTLEIKAEVRLRPDGKAGGRVVPKVELTRSALKGGKPKKREPQE